MEEFFWLYRHAIEQIRLYPHDFNIAFDNAKNMYARDRGG